MINSDLSRRAQQIISVMEQIEEMKLAIAEAYDDAASEGYTKSALRAAIKIHRLDKRQRARHDQAQADLETYLAELDGRTLQEAAE
jgi:uncharacterized protein (UPF0335 family)